MHSAFKPLLSPRNKKDAVLKEMIKINGSLFFALNGYDDSRATRFSTWLDDGGSQFKEKIFEFDSGLAKLIKTLNLKEAYRMAIRAIQFDEEVHFLEKLLDENPAFLNFFATYLIEDKAQTIQRVNSVMFLSSEKDKTSEQYFLCRKLLLVRNVLSFDNHAKKTAYFDEKFSSDQTHTLKYIFIEFNEKLFSLLHEHKAFTDYKNALYGNILTADKDDIGLYQASTQEPQFANLTLMTDFLKKYPAIFALFNSKIEQLEGIHKFLFPKVDLEKLNEKLKESSMPILSRPLTTGTVTFYSVKTQVPTMQIDTSVYDSAVRGKLAGGEKSSSGQVTVETLIAMLSLSKEDMKAESKAEASRFTL